MKQGQKPPVLDNQFSGDADLHSGMALLVNKPSGWTSYDVIRFFKKNLPEKKLGHAGTLDPMATGLLIVCSGRATKSIYQFQDMPKEYQGMIKLGEETTTYDAEGDVINTVKTDNLNEEAVQSALNSLTGEIMQKPPVFSALRQGGERLYKKARRGENPVIEARPVTVYELEILSIEMPYIQISVKCSKGTYIRSIAHDLGQILGCGGHLTGLKRTAIGPYHISNAFEPQKLVEKLTKRKSLPE